VLVGGKKFDMKVNLACFGIAEQEEYKNKARFLYGESMGGAVVSHIHRKEPEEWNGAILQAPMCKVGFLPHV